MKSCHAAAESDKMSAEIRPKTFDSPGCSLKFEPLSCGNAGEEASLGQAERTVLCGADKASHTTKRPSHSEGVPVRSFTATSAAQKLPKPFRPPKGETPIKPSVVLAQRTEAEHLPDPWLFDSAALIREIDRIRETALQVPTNGDANATHFGLQQVINAAWTLRENLRYLLALHRDGQRRFGRRGDKHQTIYGASNRLLISCLYITSP